METVRDDTDRARRIAEGQLRDRDHQVEDENANKDAVNRGVTAWQGGCSYLLNLPAQNILAVWTGHQRSCTRPMMYFLGTKPQCRLSELLFRWSPITK